MGTEINKTRTISRSKVLSGKAEEKAFINPRVKSKLKLFCLEEITNYPLEDLLYECGMMNLQIKDIAIILKMKPVELKDLLDSGKKDLESGVDTKEAKMYANYQSGLKSLEGNAVISLLKKDPEKLLQVLNPEIYSDNVADKYEIPNINIVFGNNSGIDLEAMEQEVIKQCEQSDNDSE